MSTSGHFLWAFAVVFALKGSVPMFPLHPAVLSTLFCFWGWMVNNSRHKIDAITPIIPSTEDETWSVKSTIAKQYSRLNILRCRSSASELCSTEARNIPVKKLRAPRTLTRTSHLPAHKRNATGTTDYKQKKDSSKMGIHTHRHWFDHLLFGQNNLHKIKEMPVDQHTQMHITPRKKSLRCDKLYKKSTGNGSRAPSDALLLNKLYCFGNKINKYCNLFIAINKLKPIALA